MDILAARKKAAERAQKKAAEPARQPVVEAREEPDMPALHPAAAEPVAELDAPEQPGPAVEEALEQEAEDAVEEEAAPAVQELEGLAIRMGSEDYLVMVDQVREVLKLRDITPVPHSPEYIAGVISLRGTVLPVMDLALRLGLQAGARDDQTRIVVVGLDDEDAGLIVDRVLGVVRFPEDELQPAPEAGEHAVGSEFLRGIVRRDGKLYILLDLEKATGA